MNFADLLTYVVMIAFLVCAIWVIVTLTLSIIRKIRNFNNHGKEKL
jgi:ABC-type siderophore export system fused ATPase/permease subunit